MKGNVAYAAALDDLKLSKRAAKFRAAKAARARIVDVEDEDDDPTHIRYRGRVPSSADPQAMRELHCVSLRMMSKAKQAEMHRLYDRPATKVKGK